MANGLDSRNVKAVRRAPQYGIRDNRFTASLHQLAPSIRPRRMPWHRPDMDNPLFRDDAGPATTPHPGAGTN